MPGALLLASSLALLSCGDGGSGNALVGTWVTLEFRVDDSFYPATLKFSASDWTLTVPGKNIAEKGDYSLPYSFALHATLNQNGSTVGVVAISGVF